jgi:hypothetical protein
MQTLCSPAWCVHLQVEIIPKRIADSPQPVEQLTPWLKSNETAQLDKQQAAQVMVEMQTLVQSALATGADAGTSAAHGLRLPDATNAVGGKSGTTAASQPDKADPGQTMLTAASDEASHARPSKVALSNADHAASDKAEYASNARVRSAQAASHNEASGKADANKKPVWALSEQQAAEVAEDEEAQLLDFAEGLDFDTFAHDMADKELEAAIAVRACTLKQQQPLLMQECHAAVLQQVIDAR